MEDDRVPSSNDKYFHAFTTATHREQKRWSPGPIPPCTVRKPQRHYWLITDWLGFVGQAPTGEDKVPPPHQNSFHTPKTQHIRGEGGYPPGRYRHARGGNPNSGYTTVGWGLCSRRSPLIGGKKVQQVRYQLFNRSIINCEVVVRSARITIYDARLAQPNMNVYHVR